MYEIMGALSLGVLPPSANRDEMIQTLSPEDSRKARRKWRKLWRKELKKQQKKWEETPRIAGNKDLDCLVAKQRAGVRVGLEGRRIFAKKD